MEPDRRIANSEEEIGRMIREMKSGSAEAFERFYEQYVPLVYHIALRMTRDRMEAEDVCHDVFLEAFRKWDQYDASRGSFQSWLAVRTRCRCLDRLRRKQRFRQHSWEENEREMSIRLQTASVEDTVMQAFQRETLEQALTRIPNAQREALYGMYFQDRSQKQLAEQMKRPIGTVKSMIRYGLANLRKQFAMWGWSESPGGGGKK